ncbi:DUF1990 domain-containing protein [Paenarthrobacter sp. Z7-10]|uniref:DUF1990 family protein n=1 Tax=Paenarthrobacter sp. Z7-10 TaxID=2787635 RepID=UPI0022A8F8BD|nr:DUF1990 domain-containing protein [Paenarthrobacter sp. Z7-10]MCZ2404526.1 DUF1990 domain-containing protein [Paenarthrobacter sp. Z7-10]
MSRSSGGGELTYPQHGLTRSLASEEGAGSGGSGGSAISRDTDWPEGYRRVHHRIQVAHGAQAYGRLARGILDWGIQRGAGLRVAALPSLRHQGTDADASADADGAVRIGSRVACGFGLGPIRLPIPCEVVWLEKPTAVVVLPDGRTRPQRAGFGYGTLPGHPASGEEAFMASLHADGSVYFELLAFSKPAGLIFRLGSPVTTFAQSFATQRYLQAAKELAR